MKVNTLKEVKHFVQYMSHFTNLRVINKTLKDNTWHVTLNDDTMYEMDLITWEVIQNNVTRLNKETVQ